MYVYMNHTKNIYSWLHIHILFLETGKKYVEGYEKYLKSKRTSDIPTLGMHVIGGPTMFERQKNSMLSIKEERTLPFEIICYKN